jgi:hypothetical protein
MALFLRVLAAEDTMGPCATDEEKVIRLEGQSQTPLTKDEIAA